MAMNSSYGREPSRAVNVLAMAGAAVAGLVCLIVAWGSWFTIDQGERGVILHNGAIVGEAGPGFHLKLPMITSIEKISVQLQRDVFHKTEEGDFRLQAYSRDQQPATIGMSVNYHVTDAKAVYAEFGSIANMETKLMNGRIYEQTKNVMGQYSAADSIRQRAKLNAQVFDAIKKSVKGPFIIDSVQVEDISFSKAYEQAVEAQMQATVKEQQAIALKNQRMTNADAALYEEKAKGDAVAYRGLQEAKAIEAKGAALRNNPGVVELTAAQKWNGVLPTTMVPGGATPFISVK